MNQFRPSWNCAPGVTVAALIEERNLLLTEFAERAGIDVERALDLIEGKFEISEQFAQTLSQVVGGSTAFWRKREAIYRQALDSRATETSRLSSQWIRRLPLSDMQRFGWMQNEHAAKVSSRDVLKFFDVPTVSAWRNRYCRPVQNFRFRTSKSFDSVDASVAAWLRQGELVGAKMECARWNPTHFRAQFAEIRQLSRTRVSTTFLPALQAICAESGVAMVVVRAPKGCRASGASSFLSPGKALLILSFRHLTDDHFWFTFFHEAAHLLLHSSEGAHVDIPGMPASDEEIEADHFAQDALIPPDARARLLKLAIANPRRVARFAKDIGVSPGVVVGQLQHMGLLKRNHHNFLKVRYTWE